jgi:phage shock protein A
MIKTLTTLFRARLFTAAETLADSNALTLLDQQIRDCAENLACSKKALAVAIAQDQAETRRRAAIEAQIADLETRVRAALKAGFDELALEGASALADLEAERDVSTAAGAQFAADIEKLRARLRQAETRLADLDRGRRLARAHASMQGLRNFGDEMPIRATFSEAESTLSRLRDNQRQAEDAAAALAGLDAAHHPQTITEKMASAGCGQRLRPTAEDVLRRLREAEAIV